MQQSPPQTLSVEDHKRLALWAAGYAAKASTLAAAGDSDEVTRSETLGQIAAMSDAVANALSLLPALGENNAGPLRTGRLSSGRVGETILVIQAELRDR